MKDKLLITVIFVILFSVFVNASGIGVVPGTLEFNNVLKGEMAEEVITVQNPGDEAILCSISVEGEIANWIELSLDKVKVDPKSSKEVIVRLTPPLDANSGKYIGVFKFRVDSENKESGIGLFPGVDTNIVATITNKKIIDGEVTKILTKDEQKGLPVVFNIGFVNRGNVPTRPTVKIDIKKGSEGVIEVIQRDLEEVKPGENKNYQIEWETSEQDANTYYRADVTVLLNGKIIERKEDVGFRILEKRESKSIESEKTNGKETSNILKIVLVAVYITIIFLIIYLIFRIYRKLRVKKSNSTGKRREKK